LRRSAQLGIGQLGEDCSAIIRRKRQYKRLPFAADHAARYQKIDDPFCKNVGRGSRRVE
jgi:hypothetical protein